MHRKKKKQEILGNFSFFLPFQCRKANPNLRTTIQKAKKKKSKQSTLAILLRTKKKSKIICFVIVIKKHKSSKKEYICCQIVQFKKLLCYHAFFFSHSLPYTFFAAPFSLFFNLLFLLHSTLPHQAKLFKSFKKYIKNFLPTII